MANGYRGWEPREYTYSQVDPNGKSEFAKFKEPPYEWRDVGGQVEEIRKECRQGVEVIR